MPTFYKYTSDPITAVEVLVGAYHACTGTGRRHTQQELYYMYSMSTQLGSKYSVQADLSTTNTFYRHQRI